MAAQESHAGDDECFASINITPFVDIVLVLLVIFMVTSVTIVKSSFKIELPKAAGAGERVTAPLNIVLTKENQLVCNGEVIGEDLLPARVQALVTQEQKLHAVIDADKAVPYGTVIHIINIIKKHGVVSFSLNVERDA